MKSFLLLVVSLMITANSFSQWSYVGRPTLDTIYSMSVPSPNIIWTACTGSKVYRSTDYGANWELRNTGLPAGSYSAISAIDGSNCWLGTFSGSIYKTADGGASWSLQYSQTGSFADGIKMFSSTYGIYYADPLGTGQPFQLRYTTNGGVNWLLSPNTPTSQNDYGVVNAWDWIDTARIWVGGANATSAATNARIFRTTIGFGGGGWTPVTIVGTGTSQGLYWQAIAFTNANSGMAGTNGGNIRRTTDGGASWQLVSTPPGLTGVFAVSTMFGFKDGSNIIRMGTVSAGVNRMFRTTDLGATWTEETLPLQASNGKLNHMQFVNQDLGYAAGDGGYFFRYGNPSSISTVSSETPGSFTLGQNYPNPFNPSTRIDFSVPRASEVTLNMYDINGKLVSELYKGFLQSGSYSYEFNALPQMNSGAYFYTLRAGNISITKKLLLLK